MHVGRGKAGNVGGPDDSGSSGAMGGDGQKMVLDGNP